LSASLRALIGCRLQVLAFAASAFVLARVNRVDFRFVERVQIAQSSCKNAGLDERGDRLGKAHRVATPWVGVLLS
jgi:hypothetical protein